MIHEHFGHHGPSNLVALVVDESLTLRAEAVLAKAALPVQYRFAAQGTAADEVLDVLGLAPTEKTVYLCLAPEGAATYLIDKLAKILHLHDPGSGTAFSIPLAGTGGEAIHKARAKAHGYEEELPQTEEKKVYDSEFCAVVAAINRGHSEDLMETARTVGVTGGTVVHALQAGAAETMKFWGLNIQGEKEIVLILVPRSQKDEIMAELTLKHGMKSKARGVILALPVENVVGLTGLNDEL